MSTRLQRKACRMFAAEQHRAKAAEFRAFLSPILAVRGDLKLLLITLCWPG
jgi:hypothetical protein